MVYRMVSAWTMTQTQLEEVLETARFAPCGASQEKSVGWIEPRGQAHGALVEVIDGQWMLRQMVETKAVPGSVVKRKVEERAQQIEASTGRKPGKKEKRFALPLLASSIVLFYGGVAFAYYVVCPMVFGFFTSMSPAGVTVMTDINHYLSFVLTMFFAFGFAFEIPVATVLLVWAGITTPQALTSKRPYIVVGCFVIGMVLTPPDVFSQTMLAVPMWMLFETGVLASRWLLATKARDEEAAG